MAVCCGIHLGTTYSSISWLDHYNNRVETIDLNTADGAKSIRSVVYYPGGGIGPVVGDAAWHAARQFPDRVIVGIKRSMGTAFRTASIDGMEYTPQQVSAEILKVLVRDAEMYFGEQVKDVVVTVPAYFGDRERAATEEAGRLAGLNVLALLPEPHAVALAISAEKIADITRNCLLVYKLGGGTFDVTLLHIAAATDAGSPINLEIRTLCKDGNVALGGLDWDRAIAEIVAEKMRQQFGVDVWQNPQNESVLLDNCEKAKRHLTRTGNIIVAGDQAHHHVEVSQAEIEDRTRDLLLQTQMLLEHVLQDAQSQHGISKERIDVMLAGGASRMPMVHRMVEAVMGKPPFCHRNPELLETIGAAQWAHHLQRGNTVAAATPMPCGILCDTSTYAVGVEVLRPDGKGGFVRSNSVIVPAGAGYGEEFEREFATSEDNQSEVSLVLYKGKSPDIETCEPLATLTISGLLPGRRKGQPIRLRLGYDDSGLLRGRVIDSGSGRELEITIDRSAQEGGGRVDLSFSKTVAAPRPTGSGGRRGHPEVPHNKVDRVHFSVTAPPSVLPGMLFLLDLWAHLERQREEVIRRAVEAVGGGEVVLQSKGPVQVARGVVLTAHIAIEGMIVDDPQDTILWDGEIGNARFPVRVPTDARQGARCALATIHVDGMQLAKVHFVLLVGKEVSTMNQLPARAELHRKAFASYASADREQVLPRLQGIQKAAPELEIIMDVLSLRSGQYWERELWQIIPTSDVFYLFWSEAARRSEWVEKEWRCALNTRGLDFIDPVPLVPPEDVPPPPELASKHFSDWPLAFLRNAQRPTAQ